MSSTLKPALHIGVEAATVAEPIVALGAAAFYAVMGSVARKVGGYFASLMDEDGI